MRHARILYPIALMCIVSACAAPHEEKLDEIAQIAERGDLQKADERYESFQKNTGLEEEQWLEVRRARCEVRDQIVVQRRAALTEGGRQPTRQEWRELLEFAALCKASSTYEIRDLMIAQTERDIEREIQPLYAQKAYGQMLARAPDFMAYLPADHRYARWFEQVRAAMVKAWRTRAEESLAQNLFLTSFFYTMLADDAEKTKAGPKPPPHVIEALEEAGEKIATSSLRVVMTSLRVVQGKDACSPRLIPLQEIDPSIVAESRIMPADVSVAWDTCSLDLKKEPLPSGGIKATLTLSGDASITSTLLGAQTGTTKKEPLAITVTRDFAVAPSDEAILDLFFFAPPGDIPDPDAKLLDLLEPIIQGMYDIEQIGQSYRALSQQPGLSEERIVDRLIGAYLATRTLSEQEAQKIIAAFGFDLRGFPARTLVPVFTWYQQPYIAMPRKKLTDEDAVAALDAGFPSVGALMALEFGLPEQDLVGQPDRSALGISLDTVMRFSLMKSTGKYRGLGALVGADVGLHFGKRFGGDYQDITPPPPLPPYEPDEEFQSVGVSADALALVGRRGTRFGLFLGAKPGVMHRSFGFYVTQGTRLPLAGRLEWRGDVRSGFVEAWWGGFSARNDNSSMGARLIVQGQPDNGMSSGFSLAARQDVLPAHFYGLNQMDRVRLEAATLTTASIGYWVGF